MELNQLRDELRTFANERDWGQFHTVKNLVLALMGELGELAEVIQWVEDPSAQFLKDNPQLKQSLTDELADVLLYLVRLSDVADIDLLAASSAKLEKNALRYTVEKSKGNAKKQPQ